MVNLISELFGDKSTVSNKKSRNIPKVPSSLSKLCLDIIKRNYSKELLNILHAECINDNEVKLWEDTSPIAGHVTVSGFENRMGTWYSQPEYYHDRNEILFSVYDSEHIFVNTRSKCCSTGIPSAGIKHFLR